MNVEREVIAEADPVLDAERWLTIQDVVKLTGLHRATIYRAVAAGTFPRHFQFGGRSLWKFSEYRAWSDALQRKPVTQH